MRGLNIRITDSRTEKHQSCFLSSYFFASFYLPSLYFPERYCVSDKTHKINVRYDSDNTNYIFFPQHYRHFLFTVRVVFFLLSTCFFPRFRLRFDQTVTYIYDKVTESTRRQRKKPKSNEDVQQNVLWHQQRILHNSIEFMEALTRKNLWYWWRLDNQRISRSQTNISVNSNTEHLEI